MSDEQQLLPCVICNQHNDQMLMLSCLHDPCINCAAINYVENSQKNSLFYQCSKCNDNTQLDSSSVLELQRVYRTLTPANEAKINKIQAKKFQYSRNISKPVKQTLTSNKNSRSRLGNVDSIDQYNQQPLVGNLPPATNHYEHNYYAQKLVSNYPSHPYNAPKPTITSNGSLMCSEHPQDELTYFCFSCNKVICPECAIHGSHKQHDVKTTGRAIKQIKSKLTQSNEKLSSQIGLLMHKKEQGRKHLKDLSECQKRDHQQVKKQFNRLRNMLVEKQKQFLQNITENYTQNCEETKYYATNMDKLVQGYTLVRRFIDTTMKKNDLTILQEFNQRQDQANDVLSRNADIARELKIKSMKKIDYQHFQQQLAQLAGIFQSMRLSLTSNKGQY